MCRSLQKFRWLGGPGLVQMRLERPSGLCPFRESYFMPNLTLIVHEPKKNNAHANAVKGILF